MTEKKLLVTGLALFGLLLMLLWGELLPGFGFVLGIVAIVGLIALIRSNLMEGFWRSLSITTVVFLLFFLNAWSLVTGLFPLIIQTAKDRKNLVDLQVYETFHAPAGMSLIDLRQACDTAETKAVNILRQESIGLMTEKRITDMLNSIDVTAKQFVQRPEEDKFRAKIIALKKWRAACSEFILAHTPKNFIAAIRDYVKSLDIGIIGWIAIIIFFDLAGTTLAWAVQNPEKPESSLWIRHLTFAISIALGVYLVGDWIRTQGFSMKESIKKLTAFFASDVQGLSHDIAIALTLAGIVGAISFTAGAVNRIRKGAFPAGYIAGLSLSLFVIYQLVFTH